MIRLSRIFIAPLLLLIGAACAAQPAMPSQPVIQGMLVTIVGVSEVKPSTESALVCGVSNTSNTDFTYAWSVDQGTIKGEGNKATWLTPSAPGDYAVTVAVTDKQGKTTTVSRTFKVTTDPFNNETPDATIYLRFNLPEDKGPVQNPKKLKIWTPSEIECIVADRDYSELNFKWTSPGGKLLGEEIAEGKAHRVGWIAPGQAGLYKVTVTVTDTAGNSSTGEVNFDIYCCHE